MMTAVWFNCDDISCVCLVVQVIKSAIDDHRGSVDYITECCQLSLNSEAVAPSSALSVTAANLADTNRRYESLASDVDCRLSELSVLEPRWKHFDESVCDVSDWLTVQHGRVPQLRDAAQGPALSQAALHCQVLSSLSLYLLYLLHDAAMLARS